MSSCSHCGTPAAPSWGFCPKCAAPLQEATEGNASQAVDSESATDSSSPASAHSVARSRSLFRRRLGLILSLLALGVVLALVSANDVGVHDQLHSTRADLASTRTQLYYSQLSTGIVNTRLQRTIAQNASAQASLLSTQSTLESGLQAAIGLLQGARTNAETIIIELPTVQGVSGSVILTPLPPTSRSAFALTTVINGGAPGFTYAIAVGQCPEVLTAQAFRAVSIPDGVGSAILPTVEIELPSNGVRYWIRLHVITAGAQTLSGVLGGVLGPSLKNTSAVQGTPVPPTRPAC